MERKVGIIGGGSSGLLACKYILSKGLTPIVFEAGSSIGGVWAETMETTTLQTPKELYQFTDFPWPDSVTNHYPNKQEVMDYLHSYAIQFDLLRHIRFNSKVLSIRYELGGSTTDEAEIIKLWSLWGGTGEPFSSSKRKWFLTIQDTPTLSVQEESVDFVILCVGKFSGIPNIPEFPPSKGSESFKGSVIHSMDCAKEGPEFMKSKRCTVVGFGKTAIDVAMVCSAANGVENPCTLIYRSARWTVPSDLPIPLGYMLMNRFSELVVHKPEEGWLLSLIATLLSPVRWAISKVVETVLIRKLNLRKYGMVPKHSFRQEASSCSAANLPQGFYERVDKGSIKLVKAKNFCFSDEGILIDGKAEPIKSDLVILCTGFRGADKIRDIFSSPMFKKCIAGSDDSISTIYREMIHPRIPQLAIVGFAESISNLQTSEMMCRWLGELLDGNIKLPSINEMERNIEEWDKYLKPSSYKRLCVGAYNIWFNDQLCKDIGWTPKRKKGALAELFEPYGPLDYAQP